MMMQPIINSIKNKDLPHGDHNDYLDDTVDGVSEGFELIQDRMTKDILKYLKQEKLVKSDVKKIVRDIPKIIIDIKGLEGVIQDHLNCIKFMFLGRSAGKSVTASVKKLGLIDKIPAGVIYGTFLHSIDVQSKYFEALYGKSPDLIPENILEFALHLVNSKTTRSLEQNLLGLKIKLVEAIQHQADRVNQSNVINARGTAFDAIEANRKSKDVEDLVSDSIEGKISMREAKKAIKESFDLHDASFDRILNTELQIASATGAHTAISEIYGGFDSNMKVAIVNVRDDRCCHHCEQFSRNSDGSIKLYSISELAPAGSNLSLKKDKWKPSIPPVHFSCRCVLQYIPIGFKITDDGTIYKDTKKKEG